MTYLFSYRIFQAILAKFDTNFFRSTYCFPFSEIIRLRICTGEESKPSTACNDFFGTQEDRLLRARRNFSLLKSVKANRSCGKGAVQNAYDRIIEESSSSACASSSVRAFSGSFACCTTRFAERVCQSASASGSCQLANFSKFLLVFGCIGTDFCK